MGISRIEMVNWGNVQIYSETVYCCLSFEHYHSPFTLNFTISFKMSLNLNNFHVLWHSFLHCFWTIWNSQIAHFSNRAIFSNRCHFLKSLPLSQIAGHFLKSLKNKEIQAIAQIVPFSQIGTIFSNRSKQGVGKYYIESKPPTPEPDIWSDRSLVSCEYIMSWKYERPTPSEIEDRKRRPRRL